MARNNTRISDNFFAHVDQRGGEDSCWPYLRCKNKRGYGRVWVNGRCEEAHRHAYTLRVGKIPDGLCVLHSCDFPPCCNPHHLRVGTHKDNSGDRENRNRGRQPHGEGNAQSKLTTKDIIFIRRCRDIYNGPQMAKMLGVERLAISRVLRNETWGWINDDPSTLTLKTGS